MGSTIPKSTYERDVDINFFLIQLHKHGSTFANAASN